MNISGGAVATAWRTFLSTSSSALPAHLVVLHDELESPVGTLKIRDGKASPKGHNGLKSIREKMPGVHYTRIGVGIGRPESREPDVVAGYVLRKMTAREKGAVEGLVGRVEGELRRLAGGG